VVPGVTRIAGATALALVIKAMTIAKLWQLRSGPGQDISVDLRVTPHRLCPFYEQRWELLNGYPPADPAVTTT
jgi:hypothetical protein